MCGHVYIKRKDGHPAYKAVLKRYREQKARGTSGFGYVAIENDHIVSYQRAETENEIVALLSKEKASEIMFHHRQPTGTPNVRELAHPFLIENKALDHQYFIQHNGVIRNTDKLKEMHEKLGVEYSSEMLKAFITKEGEQHVTGTAWNDSESLAVETALVLDGKKALIATEGPAAVIGLQTKGKKVLTRFFFRNHLNPLKFHEDKQMLSITSMGNGAVVEDEKIYRLKSGGGYEAFGTFAAPEPFKKTDSEMRSADWYKQRYWDSHNQCWVERAKEKDNSMGFLDKGMERLDELLGLPPKKPQYPAPEYYQPEDDDEPGKYELESLLYGMNTDELWKEYDLSVAQETALKSDIADLDRRSLLTLDTLNQKEVAEKQLETIQDWMATVHKEILTRPDQMAIDEHLSK